MFRLGLAVVGAGATLAYQLWRRMRALVFDVIINVPVTDIALTAGQRQHVCSIKISIPDNYDLGNPQKPIEFPRPSSYELRKDNLATNNRSLIFSETPHGRRKLTIDVFAHLTVSGNYSVHPKFPEASPINFIGRNYATLLVHPSKPESLTVRKILPARGDGRGSSVYRGGKAEIFIEAKDEYSNIVVDNIVFNINSSHVTLNSCRFDSENDCHVVVVDCEKEGLASLSFTSTYNLFEVLHTNAKLNIIPAPLYPTNCRILLKNVRPVVAGQVIKWKLQLYDIINHPFPLKECSETSEKIVIKVGDKLVSDDEISQKEKSSLNISLSGTHICHLEWQPLIAGNRSITVSIDGIEVGKGLLQVTVEPGPLVELRIVNVEFPNSPFCYPTDEQALSVEGSDAYGNKPYLVPMQWRLEVFKEGFHQSIETSDDGKRLNFLYSFDVPGKYSVRVKPADDTFTLVKVPDSFSVDIASPFNSKECVVRTCEEPPIFTERLAIQVYLSSSMNETFRHMQHAIRFLKVKVNDKSNVEFTSSAYNKLCDIVIHDLEYGGRKIVEIVCGDQTIGNKLHVDVVGICAFEITDYIELLEPSKKIRCDGVNKGTLIGADHANINNINRVLDGEDELSKDNIQKDTQQSHEVYFDLSDFDRESVLEVHELLCLLVKGFHHYRGQANQFGDARAMWRDKAMEAQQREEYAESSRCKVIKEKYGELMNECHSEASDAIFDFYNYDRSESEIDLHGQLVANEQSLNDLRMQLLEKVKRRHRIEHIIKELREKGDEAIRKLREHLENFDHVEAQREDRDWLEIIVGAGRHSHDRRQKIRPKVEEFLKEMDYSYIECNPGSLLITFTEYSGEEPCVANFLCEKCSRSWESATSWKGMYQKCYGCDYKGIVSKCLPFKLRSPSTSSSHHRRTVTDFKRKDHRRLCEMCMKLGRDCSK